MFLWLKRIVEALCQPLPFGAALLFVGFLLSWSRKHTRLGGCAMVLGPMIILLFGYPLVPGLLHRSLARRYQPMTTQTLRSIPAQTGNPMWVAVLCGGYVTNGSFAGGARLNDNSLARFVEGVRLYRQLPKGKVLLSVGDLSNVSIQERLLDQLTETIGIPRQDVRLVAGATCTEEEAKRIRTIVGTAPFVLVTTDYHMPRAMMIFRTLGMNPVPAPVGQCGMTDHNKRFSPGCLFPKAANLEAADGSLHEYLGIAWAELQRWGSIRAEECEPAAATRQ